MDPLAVAPLEGLRTFHAVATARSYTRAAERLRLSQPAVSARIRMLERFYGTPLFQVRHRRVSLTDEGQALFAYTQRVFSLVEEAGREVAATRALERGHLAIAASGTIGVYLLPPLLGTFGRDYPGITISLDVGTSRDVLRRVVDAEVAVGLVEAPVAHAEVETAPFAQDELVLVASPDHPYGRQETAGVDVLRAETGVRLLRREAGSGTQSQVDAALERAGIHLETAMALGSTEALKQAAMAGLGVAWLSHIAVQREVEHGELVIVRTPGLVLARPLFRVVRRGHRLPRAAMRFLEMLSGAPTVRRT